MPRTIDSIVASHRSARERISQGKASWARRLSLTPLSETMRIRIAAGEPEETVAAETCQALADLLKANLPAKWFDITDPDYDRTLDDIWEALDGTSVAEFASGEVGTAKQHLTAHLDELYDWADRVRVWLGR
jgi:hypothetical protein